MDEPQGGEAVTTVDVALCTCARLTLYHMYACNLPDVLSERLEEESAMQTASIDGIKQIIAIRGAALAQCVLQYGTENLHQSSPLVIQCLYDAATECHWFVREGDVVEAAGSTLQLLVEALTLLAHRWNLAGQYSTVSSGASRLVLATDVLLYRSDKCLELLKKLEDQ
jgi:hypothetical protein